ncbi:hypothetical protein JTE90_023005 [Oedothorax gibbosus]|uniref:PDZ domain-containing protein n=1 Tax=Oedothorax gibbosus TaxID=931172 RepID=A0AAV6U8G8_9ARAC|nr:hypothetical protein JTE90_023005 [Oedothorax gibbosus]
MKVTVYFGNVRVIVPCGKGDILVRELMDLAITRYKKATGKSQSSVVTIHNLKSSRDEGILYPDDQLNDVADDREQIIAVFDENYSPLPQYHSGDVTSTSSVCTGSPDMFSVEVGSHCSNNVEMEDAHPLTVMPLHVRRGSEPALNCLFPNCNDPNKRWSTAVVINTTEDQQYDVNENGVDERMSPVESIEINGDSKMSSLSFSRGSGRQSILGNSMETYKWVEAADRQLLKDFNENFAIKASLDAGSDTSSMSDEREKTIILKNESGPLGIHVVPDYDSKGRDTGLVIQGIESGGRIDRDGRFNVGDRITEINGQSLQNVSFQSAQEIFKNALKSQQIQLELVRGSGSKTAAAPRKPPAPVYPKGEVALPRREEPVTDTPKKEEESLVEAGGISTKVATVTPTKKVPASAMRRLASANTRRIGKMLTIELIKGHSGLGFSITTRDNPAGGNSPIYIKNVLPKGAAIEDGRLLPGDRLLEVNGTPMTGKTQTEAVSILRNIPLGKTVQIVVSRQEVEETEPMEVESEVVPPKVSDDETGIFPWKYREILTFQIPISPDSHSAGLGVSVKGKSTASGSADLGIFITSVIPGGAASKDGRLQSNDQLVNINGISLLGMSNTNAMETLRSAMTQTDGPIRNAIILTIARRIHPPPTENGGDQNGQTTSDNKLQNGISTGNMYDHSSRTGKMDLDDLQKNTPGLPGCNPVIERIMGQGSLERNNNDIYGFGRKDKNIKSSLEEKKSNYLAAVSSSQGETILIEGEYDTHARKSSSDDSRVNGDLNVIPAGSQLSLDESNPGFARDGFGRQSMSEKRHAQLDARSTGTYQRTKKAREERDKHRQSYEQDYSQGKMSPLLDPTKPDEVLGPSLGLRKSSSLESLQTMLQELNKDDEAKKRALQSGGSGSRGSRSRGCNESFRAAVDRSYDAPAAAATMETLDEESENGSSAGHLTRSVDLTEHHLQGGGEIPFQDDLLSMYCRNSKSSKKKSSLLKGLGSVFKFGKHRKQSQDLKGVRDDDSAHDSDFSQSHHSTSAKDQERVSDSDLLRRQLPAIPRENASVSSLDSVSLQTTNRQERMQSLREQYQRMHQRRQGQYPLEQREEYYENELKEKEGNYALPYEIVHGRSHSLDIHKDSSHGSKSHPFSSGDPTRYSHYMNYKEIQQHIIQRGPTATHPPKNPPENKMLPEIPYFENPHPAAQKKHSLDLPDSTYFEHHHQMAQKKGPSENKTELPYFEHQHHQVVQKKGGPSENKAELPYFEHQHQIAVHKKHPSDVASNSLPRGAHISDHLAPKYFDSHGNYGRMMDTVEEARRILTHKLPQTLCPEGPTFRTTLPQSTLTPMGRRDGLILLYGRMSLHHFYPGKNKRNSHIGAWVESVTSFIGD